jgi:glutamate/tyrosine decarboxylase-like PLP-dependent enzyme
MLQAPFGTGLLLFREGLLERIRTAEATYLPWSDHTLCGSRSGANASAAWLILHRWGSAGRTELVATLARRAAWLADSLRARGLRCFHEEGMNVVAIGAEAVSPAAVARHHLVPDDHDRPAWYKVMVMPHVSEAHLGALLQDLKAP